MSRSVVLAMTGASGAPYGLRLLQQLLASNCSVHLLISKAAEIVIRTETELALPQDRAEQRQFLAELFQAPASRLMIYEREDWFSPVASGSGFPDAMVVCPASGGTLASIASGASNNLIERAADVALKERRQLILVPRETPYSAIHLENMLKLTRMGALVMPASPGFYQKPTSVDDLVDFVVARVMDHLRLPHQLLPRWGQGD